MSALTSSDLSAIAERADAATPGPWVFGTRKTNGSRAIGFHPYDDENVQAFIEAPRRDDDAEFIAAARTDVPALLEEVQRLREGILAIITLWSVEDRSAYVLADALQGLLSEVRA